jgi:hypothetical protein
MQLNLFAGFFRLIRETAFAAGTVILASQTQDERLSAFHLSSSPSPNGAWRQSVDDDAVQ